MIMDKSGCNLLVAELSCGRGFDKEEERME